MVKFEVEGIDENFIKHPLFVDKDGKIRTGIVEYIKLIAQILGLDGVVTGTSTTAPTTWKNVLMYPLPLHSNDVGDDYVEKTLSVTAAAGATASGTGSVTATFVSNLRNKITKVRGDVIAKATVYYASSASTGTVTINSVYFEIGKIDTETGNKTSIASKTLTVGRSTTSNVTEAYTAVFGNLDFELKEGERLYLTVTVDFTFEVDATSSTASITDTATVRIDSYRGTDDTHVMLPVVM